MSPQEHRDLLLDLFAQVTQDAALLDLSPVGISIRTYEVFIQIGGKDMGAVDRLADAYNLPPERDDPYENYDRTGDVTIAGHNVRLSVYSGRPAQDDGVTA